MSDDHRPFDTTDQMPTSEPKLSGLLNPPSLNTPARLDTFERELRQMVAGRLEAASNTQRVIAAGQIVAERYRLLRKLGSGGMGVIWLAEDGDKEVALKIMRREMATRASARKRFRLEALNAAALDHANTVRVFDHGEDNKLLYIVMEYLEGRALNEVIAQGALPWRPAAQIARQVLSALQEAHEHARRIIHRDIKPSNILLMSRGGDGDLVKVLDFGIARALEAEGANTLGPIGSPHYMAPEMWRGEQATPALDLYALGCTMYEMLVGAPPFEDTVRAMLGFKHVHHPPPRLPESCPRPVARWIRRLLGKTPQERFQDAQEALHKLDALLNAIPMPADGGSATRTPSLEQRQAPQPSWPISLGSGNRTWLEGPPHHVPPLHGPLLGRQQEIETLQTRLHAQRPAPTLLHGPSGVGKTWLMAHIAHQQLPRFAGGVWWCDCEGLSDPDALIGALGHALGVPLTRDDADAQLIDSLAARGPCLLILDHAEDALDTLHRWATRWMTRAPDLHAVILTRHSPAPALPHAVPLGPLKHDSTEDRRDLAVGFFAETPQDTLATVLPQQRPHHQRAVELLLTRLRGMPQAMRLASSRYTPERVAAELTRQWSQPPDDSQPSGASLQAITTQTTRWAWGALRSRERLALIHCAIFQGDFNLDDVIAIIDVGPWNSTHDPGELLAALVRKGVLDVWGSPHRRRGRLARATRELALHRAARHDGVPMRAGQALTGPEFMTRLRDRHAAQMATRAEPEAIARLSQADGLLHLDALAADRADLLEALSHATTRQAPRLIGALSLALAELHLRLGPRRHAQHLIAQVTDNGPLPAPWQARLWRTLAKLHLAQGSLTSAELLIKRALAHRDSPLPPDERPRMLAIAGQVALAQGQKGDAAARYRASLEAAREGGDRATEAAALCGLASLKIGPATHHQTLSAAMRLAHESRDQRPLLDALEALLREAVAEQKTEAALNHHERASEVAQSLGDPAKAIALLHTLTPLLIQRGRIAEARRRLRDARDTARRLGLPHLLACHEDHLGQIALAQGHHPAAHQHFNAARELYDTQGDRSAVWWTRLRLAHWAIEVLDLSSAQDTLEALALNCDTPTQSAWLQWTQARLALEGERHHNAFEHLNALSAHQAAMASPALRGRVLRLCARLALEQGEVEAAIKTLLQARKIFERLGVRYEQSMVLIMLALCGYQDPDALPATLQAATLQAQAEQMAIHFEVTPLSRLGRWIQEARQACRDTDTM